MTYEEVKARVMGLLKKHDCEWMWGSYYIQHNENYPDEKQYVRCDFKSTIKHGYPNKSHINSGWVIFTLPHSADMFKWDDEPSEEEDLKVLDTLIKNKKVSDDKHDRVRKAEEEEIEAERKEIMSHKRIKHSIRVTEINVITCEIRCPYHSKLTSDCLSHIDEGDGHYSPCEFLYIDHNYTEEILHPERDTQVIRVTKIIGDDE